MTFADYQRLTAVNWSSLKHLRVSPLHYKHALETPREDTEALKIGRAAHTAILEPDEFPLRYVLRPDGIDRRTKDGKAAWDALLLAANGKEILAADDYRRCLAMRDQVRKHGPARRLLAVGSPEQSRIWTDEATGIECKARLDWEHAADLFADLKTARTIASVRFASQAWSMGYFHQFATYRRAQAAHHGRKIADVQIRIIAVESVAPHDVAVWTPEPEAVEAADREVSALLDRLKACRDMDEWPGQYPEETELFAPRWAFDAADEFNWIATEEAA